MPPPWGPGGLLLLAGGTALLSLLLTRVVLVLLYRGRVLDHPGERSSHTVPVPRGGGLGILGALVPIWLGLTGSQASLGPLLPLFAGLGLLILICWMDDVRSLPARVRLLAQGAAVGLGLLTLPADALLFQGLLSPLADRLLAGLAWVWFLNVYNFMDGLDGLVGGQTVVLGAGIALLGLILPALAPIAPLAAALGGAALGFLWWNWRPARLFMGDVGSVPLGFLLGWMLLTLAGHGLWPAALLLPAYFLADTGITLLRRLARGEKVWQAHRQHLYQRATRSLPHDGVAKRVLAGGAGLAAAALLSVPYPPGGLLLGSLALAALWLSLERAAQR